MSGEELVGEHAVNDQTEQRARDAYNTSELRAIDAYHTALRHAGNVGGKRSVAIRRAKDAYNIAIRQAQGAYYDEVVRCHN